MTTFHITKSKPFSSVLILVSTKGSKAVLLSLRVHSQPQKHSHISVCWLHAAWRRAWDIMNRIKGVWGPKVLLICLPLTSENLVTPSYFWPAHSSREAQPIRSLEMFSMGNKYCVHERYDKIKAWQWKTTLLGPEFEPCLSKKMSQSIKIQSLQCWRLH